MGIRIERVTLVYESVSMTPIEPGNLISKKEAEAYLEEHPFPKDERYSEDDFLNDLDCTGFWTLPDGLKDETLDYIKEALDALF